MEHIELTHTPGDLRQPLAAADIITMCRRAFGRGTRVESAHELGGGEYNTTYRVRMAGAEPVILRVAPPPGARLFWDERDLMRKEQAIQPYFAPIATLMPRTLLVDFTHQLIDRDYMFQTYMRGERWLEVEHELTPAEDEALWRQFARIVRSIHDVEGDSFGYPYPGPHFPSWSLAVLDIVDRVVSDLEEVGLDTTDILSVRRVVTENRDVFDEITRPRLTHGDLWPFNMLIERGPDGAAIVAVIDADRAWWCDPMPIGPRTCSGSRPRRVCRATARSIGASTVPARKGQGPTCARSSTTGCIQAVFWRRLHNVTTRRLRPRRATGCATSRPL